MITNTIVGLVGVGAMGRALLTLLKSAGRTIQAFDVDERARGMAHERGAVVVQTAADAARGAEFIHVFVVNDDDAIEVVSGAKGILAGAEPGAMILLNSTVLPETTRRLAAIAKESGVDLIDAPVTSVPAKFESGEGVFLVGGSEASIERARPQLLLAGKEVLRFGELGAGNVAKIVKALVNANERVAWSEALAIAAAGGLDLRQFLNFEREHSVERCIIRWEHVFDIVDNRATHRPVTNLFRKDIFLAEKMADAYGLSTPMTHGAARTAERWLDMWDRAAGKKL